MLIDHSLVVLFGVALPLYGWFRFPKTRLALQTTPNRARLYTSSAVLLWIMALAALAWCWYADRPLAALGLKASLDATVIMSLAVVGAAVAAGWLFQPWLLRLYQYNTVTELLPRTPGELRSFSLLAVSAGITEEIFYRGYLIWYLQQTMPLAVAALVSAIWFAIAHAYQGVLGVFIVALIGAVFTVLYVWSGSLLAPMLLHAAIDIYAGFVGYRLFGERNS